MPTWEDAPKKKGKVRNYGTVKEMREPDDRMFLYHVSGKAKGEVFEDPMVPKGLQNEVSSIKLGHKVVGDIVLGPDGFIEAMFQIDGKLVKLKKHPDMYGAYIGVW